MLSRDEDISIRKQAELLDVSRNKIYYRPVINDKTEIINSIMDSYLASDCRYGYRKIMHDLRNQSIIVNHKVVLKTMQALGIRGLYPKQHTNTSINNKEHKIYPYLLKGLDITHKDQVWATDITYISIDNKFMYFMAIIDIHSRYIVGYSLSHSLEAEFCVDILTNALKDRQPIIFNTDQGCQYTSNDFTAALLDKNIQISMSHKGRCFDNIYIERLWRTLKQESIYFYRPDSIKALEQVLVAFVNWYNNYRLHQALQYKTPASVYFG